MFKIIDNKIIDSLGYVVAICASDIPTTNQTLFKKYVETFSPKDYAKGWEDGYDEGYTDAENGL